MADGNYNDRPSNWIEISEEDFKRDFFCYCFKQMESRQIEYVEGTIMQGVFNTRLFDLDYNHDLGIALVDDWKEKKLRYFRYGTESWEDFERGFANQFAGDNS